VVSRLVGAGIPDAVCETFRSSFGKEAYQRLVEPVERARNRIEHRRFELASSAYQVALKQMPWNWTLIDEVARYLTFSLRDPAAGLAMSRSALALNPSCSADLWNTLGDSLCMLGRDREALAAFHRALRIRPGDVRARYNLACVHIQRRDHSAALEWIAQGLSLDRTEAYWKGFLRLQSDALEALARQFRTENQHRNDRVSKAVHPADQPGILPIDRTRGPGIGTADGP
jgi:tetratricopeptide (TPR) repeat protein